jgi:class 3 adenylate cyclase
VNLAAHLMDHCRPGSVMVSQSSKQRAERRLRRVRFDRRRRVKVQGVPEKVEVWRVEPATADLEDVPTAS